MSKIDYLSLVSGQDVLLKEFKLVVRQPRLKEIAMIGEKEFYSTCNFLLVTKESIVTEMENKYPTEDIAQIYSEVDEYAVVMEFVLNATGLKEGMFQMFELLFPEYKISIEEIGIFFMKEGAPPVVIRPEDYGEFRDCLKQILCLGSKSMGSEEYNTVSAQADAIAEKLRARKKKLEGTKDKEKNSNILANYISSLSIGVSGYNIQNIVDLTLYQLFDQIKRYGLWMCHDIALRAKMAGAKDVEDVEWMGKLE